MAPRRGDTGRVRRLYDAAQFGHRCGLLQLESWDSGLSLFRIPLRAETEETFG